MASPEPYKQGQAAQPVWRDLWAAIIFYVQFAVFLGLAGYQAYCMCQSPSSAGGASEAADHSNLDQFENFSLSYILLQLGGSTLIAGVLTVLLLHTLRRSPVAVMHASFLGLIALSVFSLISSMLYYYNYSALAHSSGGLIISLIISAFLVGISIMLYLGCRHKFSFAAVILNLVNDTVSTYSKIMFQPAYAAITMVALIFLAGFTFQVVPTLATSEGGAWALLLFLIFSLLWTAQVVYNVFYTTMAGVFATSYFTANGQKVDKATSSSFKRAVTYSFGSICFGSLIVATIQVIRILVRSISDKNSISGAIADCFLGIIEDLAAYFNAFAYIEVAIYGKPFLQAGKDVWSLIKRRGIEAVVNDSIIGTIQFVMSLLVALATCAICVVMSIFVLGRNSYEVALGGTVAFLVGMGMAEVVFSVIVTGSRTIFVCMAEDPAALQRNNPAAYNAIVNKYGHLAL